jgi:hypothetical protein
MKKLLILAVLAMVPASNVLAQSSIDDEINAELDRMYSSRGSRSQPSVQVNVQTTPTQNQVVDQKAGQSADLRSSTSTVQKAPVTVIEATPLMESRAEKIRRVRQEEELRTEARLVEKLEMSRMEDEKKRVDALFGERVNVNVNSPSQLTFQNSAIEQNANNNKGDVQQTAVIDNKANETQAVVVDSPKAVVAQPSIQAETVKAPPVVVEKPAVVVIDDSKLSSHVELKELKEEKTENVSRSYLGASAGMGEYPDVQNVRGDYAFGFSMGRKINDRTLVEGTFVYARYQVEQFDSGPYGFDPIYPRITEMNQYGFGAAVKYQITGGSLRPLIGGLAQYSYRTFSDVQFGFANNDASSHALDLGLLIGADFEVSSDFAIGLDMKYMMNVYNRASNQGLQTRFSQSVYNSATPIEKLSSLITSITARFTF